MKDVLKKLENDEHYYGKFGKQYLSNSDISTLLTNPLALGQPSKQIPAFLVGGYFHTAILEPEKLKKFKIVESTTRNTKAYKEITTADLNKFKWSASKYNYDSQAYIYSKLFGYEFIFIAIDKTTHQIGIFDCSSQFYERGADKVQRASEQYKLFYQSEDFDPQQFFINQTL